MMEALSSSETSVLTRATQKTPFFKVSKNFIRVPKKEELERQLGRKCDDRLNTPLLKLGCRTAQFVQNALNRATEERTKCERAHLLYCHHFLELVTYGHTIIFITSF
jgi:hypothetical protein